MGLAWTIWLLALLTSASARDLTLPDAALTPGATVEITVETICATRWGRDARHVTPSMRRKVLALYEIEGEDIGSRYELDHLISRELGGADLIINLWPQPRFTHPWNAARKDRVENRLHKEVCAGNVTLEAAQQEIRTDYRVPFVRYFGEPTQ